MCVSIVMPCYNEEQSIETAVRECYVEIAQRMAGVEIIVVDDGSVDASAKILDRLVQELKQLRVIRHASNHGYGSAVLAGYSAATCPHVLLLDSDSQIRISEFWRLYDARGGYDLVLGYRHPRQDPRYRRVLSRLLRLLIRSLFGVWVRDANCPFRLLRRDFLAAVLPLISKTKSIPNISMSIVAGVSSGIAEVAVGHRRRSTGTSTLADLRLVRFCWSGLLELLWLKRRLSGWLGR